MPLLNVENLTVRFDTDDGPLTAVDGVTFCLNAGESVGLVGESGCGKSVTALAIARLIPCPPGSIESGHVYFNDQDLLRTDIRTLKDIRGNQISMIFQEPLSALSPLLRIEDQMIEAVFFHRDMSRGDARLFVLDWLSRVGIPDPEERLSAYPYQLSGGMQQRVMIAMALMMSPDLVIADEPTTALDVTTQAQIFALLSRMVKKRAALLLITHDMGVVWETCDRVVVMYASRVVETGGLKDVFFRPAHPYTRGLLAAIPSLSRGKARLSEIPGQVPSPLAYPDGCHFMDRCRFAFDRCKNEKPALFEVGEEHMAACFLVDQKREKSRAVPQGRGA
ncbi:MAG: ABC transporter ATP-binding protein [Deltaproteobacteria bacterium]|nr:ABC transporter ATP-binding protein [Deltaproteobacteria bacterium]